MRANISKKMRGFTLIELLIVMGILGILLAIVLIALNPQQQFKQANNTQRQSDVTAVLDALHQYLVDHKGAIPTGITSTAKTITSTTGTTNIDLCSALVPTYIANLPTDPTTGTRSPANSICTDSGATYSTGYTVSVSATNNRLTVAAPSAELSATISVTR
jgi:prepilin-type N-terminal cleavage/methylation domain-containing protein